MAADETLRGLRCRCHVLMQHPIGLEGYTCLKVYACVCGGGQYRWGPARPHGVANNEIGKLRENLFLNALEHKELPAAALPVLSVKGLAHHDALRHDAFCALHCRRIVGASLHLEDSPGQHVLPPVNGLVVNRL